ncbi:MAG: 2-amino-4-hydroxy-6-hydroxymethyldihydropteridine diphosphokinase, partial [Planctomycetes bacterium RBG_13_63_9]
MASCLIGLGSNLGNRHEALDQAVARLGRHPAMSVTATSRWHETAAIGGPSGQPPFLNGVAVLETALSPEAVLDVLQQVEADLGRRRSGQHLGRRWKPRTIDLDLLLYDEMERCTPSLVLPHPRMAWRRFVLQPAAEVAGSMVHPLTGWSITRLLRHLDTAIPYVAITGSIGAGKTRLAQRLAECLAGRIAARMIAEPIDLGRLEAFYADPPGTAWQTELEFLDERVRLLAADSPDWNDRR